MKVDLWITILLAIPLAIIANLLTPKIKNWLDGRSETTKKLRTEKQLRSRQIEANRIRNQLEEVTSFRSDTQSFHSFVLIQLVRIAFYGAVGGIYGGVFSMVGGIVGWSMLGEMVARFGTSIIALFTSTLIFQTSLATIRMHKRIRDFEGYKTEAEGNIKSLES